MEATPAIQMRLPFEEKGNAPAAEAHTERPVGDEQLMERMLERENLARALRRVERNGGSGGVDGMEVEDLRPYLKIHWPRIRKELLEGTYDPHPVRWKEIPTVLDRFIQQVMLQALQPQWDTTFSDNSFGFRKYGTAPRACPRDAC